MSSTITGYFGFGLEENSVGESHNNGDDIVFEKLRFQNVFLSKRKCKPGLKSVFEKLRFVKD